MAEAPNPALDPHPLPMDVPAAEPDDAAASTWDWGSLLDFAIDEDDPLILSWGDSPPPISNPPVDLAPASSRVRKRDPRLVCENYLAGRVPCACPEMDAMELEGEGEDEEEAVAAGGKKRARAGGAVARCQVPGCEVDIGELKGYHRRHRVCLRCANASSVVIDGEDKRYCQQCGKFHILPDFDEGKRSCRRKLERHNKRRRRKPTGGRNILEKEKDSQGNWSGDIMCDAEPRKDVSNGFPSESVETVVSNKVMEKEMLVESEDGHGSPNCSLPNSQNVQSNSIVSVAASDGDHIDERIDNTKSTFSSTLSDNKSIYSSVCQTGRISFKLYDWNPAEFPRRLRHQIFEWLANMPVELEGYIRPGCTILTVFIAMPQFMWEKLHEDVALYVRNLVNAPESLFLGKGNFLIYLGNRIVQILKDGTSLVNIEMNVKAPRLHYIYPSYFEAGKPMEFFACGSNLDQPKLRFLVSFAGKYLVYDSCHALSHGKIRSYHGSVRDSNNSDHEFFRISIFRTDSEVFGPAFIEVENESGLSNFLPILFGSKHICSELERMQETFSESASTNSIMSQITVSGVSPSLCKHFVSKQGAISELLLDIAWLLKKPCSDTNEFILTSTNIQRLTCLLQFAMKNELVSVLKVIQHYVDNIQRLDKSVSMASKADLGLLLKYMSHGREFLDRRDPVHGLLMPESYNQTEVVCILPWKNQDVESRSRDSLVSTRPSASLIDEENIPLVTEQIIHRQRKGYSHICVGWPQEGWPNNIFPWKAASGVQLAVFVMFGVVVCFGACVALIHPHKARDFAISIRRGLFGGPLT